MMGVCHQGRTVASIGRRILSLLLILQAVVRPLLRVDAGVVVKSFPDSQCAPSTVVALQPALSKVSEFLPAGNSNLCGVSPATLAP